MYIELKSKLLRLNVFIDNNYLNKYIELCLNNINTVKIKFKTERHHIIPKSYYILNNLEIDNSNTNLVNLSIEDHILAHYYLCGCISDRSLYIRLCCAFYLMTSEKYNYISEEDLIKKLPKLLTYKEAFHLRQKEIFQSDSWREKVSISWWKPNHIPWNKDLTKFTHPSMRIISEKNHLNQLGKIPWNKNLTKDIDFRLSLSAEKRLHTLFEKTGYYGTNNGKKFSIETRKLMSDNMKGLHSQDIWINNGKITKHVSLDEYNLHYSDWTLGRKIEGSNFIPYNKGKKYSEEYKKRLSQSALNRRQLTEEQKKIMKEKCSIAARAAARNKSYCYFCIEDNLEFYCLKDVVDYYKINEYFIKKSINKSIAIDGKTFIKIDKKDLPKYKI